MHRTVSEWHVALLQSYNAIVCKAGCFVYVCLTTERHKLEKQHRRQQVNDERLCRWSIDIPALPSKQKSGQHGKFQV